MLKYPEYLGFRLANYNLNGGEYETPLLEALVQFYQNNEINYGEAINYFKNKKGIEKRAFAAVIAINLTNNCLPVEVEFIEELLNNLPLEYRWSLATDAKNPLVKDKAYNSILMTIDEYDEIAKNLDKMKKILKRERRKK